MASEEWITATIESLIEEGVITGHKDGNHGSNYPRVHEFGSEGVPFLTAKLLDDTGRIDFDSAPRLADAKADKLSFGFIASSDVLLSHNATVGRVAVVPELEERVLIGTSLTYFRVDAGRLSPRYLAAYFAGRDFQNQLKAVMSHTTRNQVPITAQRRLSIVFPPLREQEAIADILSVLDAKIKLNRKINQTFEQIAQAIFKSWFVDFEPVKAKQHIRALGGNDAQMERAAQAVIAGTVNLGVITATTDLSALDQQLVQALSEKLAHQTDAQREQLATTANYFPDQLVESESGLIPEGWESKALYDTAEFINGAAFKSKDFSLAGEGLPIVKIAELKSGVSAQTKFTIGKFTGQISHR